MEQENKELRAFVEDDEIEEEEAKANEELVQALNEENTRLRQWVNALELQVYAVFHGKQVCLKPHC